MPYSVFQHATRFRIFIRRYFIVTVTVRRINRDAEEICRWIFINTNFRVVYVVDYYMDFPPLVDIEATLVTVYS
jgi:hypothetical protein